MTAKWVPTSKGSYLDSTFTTSSLDGPYSSFLLLPDMLPECRILRCRCGVIGDGDDIRRLLNVQGDTVQCDFCEEFSHVACQQDGIEVEDNFICSGCNVAEYFRYNTPQARQRRFMERIQKFGLPLTSRLRPGQGALARHEDFWYPVRLIRKVGDSAWIVKWWYENVYPADGSGVKPSQISTVTMEDITDSMWGDRKGRRAIRLGRWKHPHEVPTADDILSDPKSIPYTPAIHDILSGHTKTLYLLLADPSQIAKDQTIPAKSWLEDTKRPLLSTLVPYAGALSIVERAQISNWFEIYIGKRKSTRRFWLGYLPLAHAFTLYIAAGLRTGNPEKYENFTHNEMLEEAWLVQSSQCLPSPSFFGADVDKESLDRLEEEMFEVSSRAGVAGHYQWGLDAGCHQEQWCPYISALNHGDYERLGDDEELKPGPEFLGMHQTQALDIIKVKAKVDNGSPQSPPQPKPRPKPRLLTRKAPKNREDGPSTSASVQS